MKIITNGNRPIKAELARDYKHAGKIRHFSSLEVEAFRISPNQLVEVPYTIADGEVLNAYISWEQSKAILIPQLERDLLIPIPLQDFAMVMDLLGEWKQRHPGEQPNGGIEPVIWHDPMIAVEFDD